MAFIKKKHEGWEHNVNNSKGVRKEFLQTPDKNVNLCSRYGNQFGGSSNLKQTYKPNKWGPNSTNPEYAPKGLS